MQGRSNLLLKLDPYDTDQNNRLQQLLSIDCGYLAIIASADSEE